MSQSPDWRRQRIAWRTIAALIVATCALRVHAQGQYQGWKAGEPIPLAVDVGPLGATLDFEVRPIGAADVFGNGPYDLFLKDRKLLPFRRFLPDGVPVYGQPVDFKTDGFSAGSIFPGPGNRVWGFFTNSKSAWTSEFRPQDMAFAQRAKSDPLASKTPNQVAASLTSAGDLLVAFSVQDDVAYNPDGPHLHAPEFRPFNGSGIWLGGLPRASLGAGLYRQGTQLAEPTIRFPWFKGDDFLFTCAGISFVNLGPDHTHDLVAADRLGQFHYYHNEAGASLRLQPSRFVSDERGNALRHPGIFPTPIALPDPNTGQSNLVVGDTGQMWFYHFTGRFNQHGGPIYDAPTRVMVESPLMSLSALPVITPGDLDNDGRTDIVAGNDVGDFYFLRNIGSPTQSGFDAPRRILAGGKPFRITAGYGTIQGPGEARWGYSCPTLYDWNNDGLLDIVFNSIKSNITILLHEPGTNEPRFDEPVVLSCDSLEMQLVWRTQPAVTNWGKPDGPACIVVNDEQNILRRFWRIDDYNVSRGDVLRLTTGQPIQTHHNRQAGQLGRTKLQAIDWDGDGVIDLLAGTGRSASIPGPGGYPDDAFKGDERQSSVLFLRNAGSNDDPVFEFPRLVCFNGKKIELGAHSCSPLAADWGRGQLDLLVGMEQGVVIYYPREQLTWPATQP